ncbi:hypothetical protein [Stakelama marina]|uniref:Uncharacterized protein n=1 Tax=Stakelama marina TaxID=2826939 RepID=A0A8T4IIC0_9SPHN|nr:hypothetical protein [Stakelama marina]MBR0552845.1 hypothetical protein [Stakelama marina]
MIPILVATAAFLSPAPAQHAPDREIGKETSIPFADHDALRNWQAGKQSNILYVQDNRRRWYRVELSGPCLDHISGYRIAYSTGPTGSFDTFSKVYSNRFPGMVCSVVSVKTSLAPDDKDHDSVKEAEKEK